MGCAIIPNRAWTMLCCFGSPSAIRERSRNSTKDIHMMKTVLALSVVVLLSASSASAQAVAGAERARPVAGDPGITTMVAIDRPEFRVLRDYADPGATRRMHSHDDATYHVFVLVTGQLLLTIEGESPVEVTPGQALYLKGGAKHTFKNTGTVAATIVEVFGRAPAAAARHDERDDNALAQVIAAMIAQDLPAPRR
jgi:quercetin dioxygenase-like cupin family protein